MEGGRTMLRVRKAGWVILARRGMVRAVRKRREVARAVRADMVGGFEGGRGGVMWVTPGGRGGGRCSSRCVGRGVVVVGSEIFGMAEGRSTSTPGVVHGGVGQRDPRREGLFLIIDHGFSGRSVCVGFIRLIWGFLREYRGFRWV